MKLCKIQKFIFNVNKSTGICGMGHNYICNIQGKLPVFKTNCI